MNYLFCKDRRYGVLAIDFLIVLSLSTVYWYEGLKTLLAQACEKILQSIVDDKFKILILRTIISFIYLLLLYLFRFLLLETRNENQETFVVAGSDITLGSAWKSRTLRNSWDPIS